MKKIYLAGHSLEFEYRKYCIDNFSNKYELIDPIARQFTTLDKNEWNIESINKGKKHIPNEIVNQIVECDKEDILKSSYLLAYIKKPTMGTIMEIMFAYIHKIPIVVVNPEMDYCGDIWLKYHAVRIVNSLDEAFKIFNSIDSITDEDIHE